MNRLLPAPVLSAALFVTWLMLSESVSAGHLLLGAALALALPPLTAGWRHSPLHRPPRRPAFRAGALASVLRLAGRVGADIVRANLSVARRILGDERHITPRYVRVPLRLREPPAMALLAGIVTMTPGTLSADLDEARGELLLHAFDVDDDAAEAALVAEIQSRYEAPLITLFEGSRGKGEGVST